MIPAAFDYLRPTSIGEALEMVSRQEGPTFLAGGHAVLPEAKLRHTRPSALIDLGRIAELRGIDVREDAGSPRPPDSGGTGLMVHIGAMTTSAEIEHSPDIARAAPLLSAAAAVISDPLIRNRATLGGSIATADPHGDWPPIALAADATMHLRGLDGERTLPAQDFFSPNGTVPEGRRTALRPGELLTGVTVPAVDARTRSTYLKRMHPASGYAMLGVAVMATFAADDTCRGCRIAITGAGATVTRAVSTEHRLVGSRLTPEAIEGAATAANDGIGFVGDAFGSAEYLAELLPLYVYRALSQITTLSTPSS